MFSSRSGHPNFCELRIFHIQPKNFWNNKLYLWINSAQREFRLFQGKYFIKYKMSNFWYWIEQCLLEIDLRESLINPKNEILWKKLQFCSSFITWSSGVMVSTLYYNAEGTMFESSLVWKLFPFFSFVLSRGSLCNKYCSIQNQKLSILCYTQELCLR